MNTLSPCFFPVPDSAVSSAIPIKASLKQRPDTRDKDDSEEEIAVPKRKKPAPPPKGKDVLLIY